MDKIIHRKYKFDMRYIGGIRNIPIEYEIQNPQEILLKKGCIN